MLVELNATGDCDRLCIQGTKYTLVSLQDNAKQDRKAFNKTEDDLKALQSVGQIIGEVL